MKRVVLGLAARNGLHNLRRGVNSAGLTYHGESKAGWPRLCGLASVPKCLTRETNSVTNLHVEVRV
ncbi:MAG: hypothetical protein LBF87_04520 [Treponema sp.]|jgi:hypothetical protein|nr:hypothetical protein [Treponema sp.]